MDYLRDLDSDQCDFSPMIHLFSKDIESPIMIMQLPPMTSDTGENVFAYVVITFYQFITYEVVSVVQDTWFTKVEKLRKQR